MILPEPISNVYDPKRMTLAAPERAATGDDVLLRRANARYLRRRGALVIKERERAMKQAVGIIGT